MSKRIKLAGACHALAIPANQRTRQACRWALPCQPENKSNYDSEAMWWPIQAKVDRAPAPIRPGVACVTLGMWTMDVEN